MVDIFLSILIIQLLLEIIENWRDQFFIPVTELERYWVDNKYLGLF